MKGCVHLGEVSIPPPPGIATHPSPASLSAGPEAWADLAQAEDGVGHSESPLHKSQGQGPG